MKKVNISDVARRAGVSIATVSYALNDGGRVATKTRKKVLDAAAELGFIPDNSAIRLRTGRSNLIGAIINDINNPFFSELVSEFEAAAWNSGFLTIIAASQDDPERQRHMISSMISHGIAGLVVSPVKGSGASDFELLRSRSIPYLICVRDIEDHQAGFVGADDFEAGRIAARVALDNGHRRIAFFGGYEETATWRRRLAGMRSAFAESGQGDIFIDCYSGSEGYQFGRQIVTKLLSDPDAPTLFVGLNDDTAVGAYLAAHDAGLKVGVDLSVIGFDNIPLSQTVLPGLTTIELFPRRMGRECAASLMGRLSEPDASLAATKLAPTLIERGSVARIST